VLHTQSVSPFPLIEPDMWISRIKCGAPHLMRNVAPVDMWRSAPKVAAEAGWWLFNAT
jgi:hypothetical protein